jgi:hypothetical protein
MQAMYTVFDVNQYPERATDLKEYLTVHVDTITRHYAKAPHIIKDAQVAADQFLPGPSGTTGLAASLRIKFRGKWKTVETKVTSAPAPDYLAENPYFLPDAPLTKKTEKKLLLPGDVCSRFLQNEQLREAYPEWEKLATIFLVYTTSSAECERGVSALSLQLVKTAKRNRLSQAALEQLMLIKIQGPALERLDWDAAAVMFFSKQARRAKVDARYTRGRRSGYKWGNVYGQDDNEPGLEEDVDAKENGDQVDHEQKAAKPSASDIKARICTGHNPEGVKAAEEKRKQRKEQQKRKRDEKKAADAAVCEEMNEEDRVEFDANQAAQRQQAKDAREA